MPRRLRKQEEIGSREETILAMVRTLMTDKGYQGFTMADVATAIDYAKGTLYLHFESKEDMAVAVACRNLTRRADLLKKAVTRQAPSRERIMGLLLADEQFRREEPDHFAWDHLLRQPSFWDRVSPKRQAEHSAITGRCLSLMELVVEQAVREGDLPRGIDVRHTVIQLLALALGQTMIFSAPELQHFAGNPHPEQFVEHGYLALLDGLEWKPVGRLQDWPDLRQKLLQELAPAFAQDAILS